MLLCDSAQVAGEKLYILGGGWSIMGPDPAPSAIAMKIDVDWHETDMSAPLELYLEDADGRPVMVDTPEGSHPLEVRSDFQVARPASGAGRHAGRRGDGDQLDAAAAGAREPIHLAAHHRWRVPRGLGAFVHRAPEARGLSSRREDPGTRPASMRELLDEYGGWRRLAVRAAGLVLAAGCAVLLVAKAADGVRATDSLSSTCARSTGGGAGRGSTTA